MIQKAGIRAYKGQKIAISEEKYRVDEYGQEWVLKDASIKLNWIDTGLVGGRKWFRISDEDETTMFWVTSILGPLGIHKIMKGNIAACIFYLITCGGFGVLTILDVLQFLTGSAGYETIEYYEDDNGVCHRQKERVFFKELENKWIVLIGLCCAVLVTFVLAQLAYRPIMMGMAERLGGMSVNMNQETLLQDLSIVESIWKLK